MPAPSLCTVSGTLYNAAGTAVSGAKIRALVMTSFTDAYGNVIAEGLYASTTTASDGTWSLAVIQTASLNQAVTFQFIYPLNNNQTYYVSYPAVIPNTSTAAFSSIVDLSSSTATVTAAATTDNLAEGVVNLYATQARARAALSATSPMLYNSSTGVISTLLSQLTSTDALPEGTTNLYSTQARSRAALSATSPILYNSSTGVISTSLVSIPSTDALTEGSTNLYFTNARADARITAQKGAASGLAPLGGDSKINVSYLPSAVVGDVQYQGVWDASANSPSLASSTGPKGNYYVVTVSGSTNLDGITDWKVGDWAISNGATWNKVDNTDAVSSVNSQVGAVVLTSDNVSEGATNLYTTQTRSRAALSATAPILYNSGTGVISTTLTQITSTDALTEGSTNLYFTNARARNALTGTSPIAINSSTGVVTIQVANTTQDGYLASADWNTFNGKQASGSYITALTGDGSASGPGSSVFTLATVTIAKGGTGQTSKTSSFDALQPMSASGDIIYGGTAGTGTRLAKGTNGQVLTLVSGLPSWATGGGGTGTALVNALTQTSHGFSVGDVLYYNGTSYAKAKADADATSEAMGVVSAVADANNFSVTTSGYVTGLGGLTAGTTYYLSGSSAGGISATDVTTVGYISKPLFIAVSTSAGYVIHSRGILLGSSVNSTAEVWVADSTGANLLGTTNTFVRRFNSTIVNSGGSDITYTSSSTNGDSFTINTTGVYAMTYQDTTTSTSTFGITKNASGTQLTSSVNSQYGSNVNNAYLNTWGIGSLQAIGSLTLNLVAGDVIRAQTSSTPTGGNYQASFRITKVK